MKTIVIGVGNPILGNDGVGIQVINELRKRLSNVALDTASTGGINLLERIREYKKAIIIDAIRTEGKEGEVKRFSLSDLPRVHSFNLHDISLYEAVQLFKKLGDVPEIVVIGIILKEVSFGEGLNPEVERAIPRIVDLVLSEVKEGQGR